MKFHKNRSVILTEEHISRMVDAGAWDNQLLSDHFSRCVQNFPDKVAVKSFSLNRDQVHALTFSAMDGITNQIASAFQRLGIGLSDVVSFQLENR